MNVYDYLRANGLGDNTLVIVAEAEGDLVALTEVNLDGGVCSCCSAVDIRTAEVVKAFDAVTGEVYYSRGEG